MTPEECKVIIPDSLKNKAEPIDMTGKNKYVLSVYAKMICVDYQNLKFAILNCQDTLSITDKRQFAMNGIPVDKINTKDQLLEYILTEVKKWVPVAQNQWGRKNRKVVDNLSRLIKKSLSMDSAKAKELLEEQDRIADLMKITGCTSEKELKDRLKSSKYSYEFIREFYMKYGKWPD